MSVQSTLGQKQREFTIDLANLIVWAYQNGYELTFGDTYRDPRVAKFYATGGIGIANSLHCYRLAADLNLFINDEYQAKTEAYKPLGEYWKSLREGNCWGGDFSKPDGNHLSRTHEGHR